MNETKCPICAKPSAARYKPFCSGRCAERDLGRWLNESYAIPAREATEDDDEEESGASPNRKGYH